MTDIGRSRRALDIQTRETDSANVCSGEGATKSCSHDCLSAFWNKEMLKKAARWRMQWHNLSKRQRQQVLLDYLRKKQVHQASM